jgi:putative ABC transport system permease protein
MDEQYANRIKVRLGDRLTFNVQGKTIETVVGHFRKVDYSRVQTNFIVLFPQGVLEPAPQFHVLVTRVPSNEVSAAFQQYMVQQYPNVSVIDLGLILKTLDEVIAEISFVVRFMALFSIATGLLVLGASVVISRYQRIQESVLLRTLGAQQRHIYIITAIEYFMLGSLASLTGIGLALAATWSLALFSFELTFTPQLWPSLVLWLLVSSITMLIGMLNIRSIAARPPLEVLRAA